MCHSAYYKFVSNTGHFRWSIAKRSARTWEVCQIESGVETQAALGPGGSFDWFPAVWVGFFETNPFPVLTRDVSGLQAKLSRAGGCFTHPPVWIRPLCRSKRSSFDLQSQEWKSADLGQPFPLQRVHVPPPSRLVRVATSYCASLKAVNVCARVSEIPH